MFSAPRRDPKDWPRVYLGVFFTTLSALILELALTRVFSVIFYYHFAFLAISIALFGLGGGGLLSYLLLRRGGEFRTRAAALLLANSFFIPLALLVLVNVETKPGVGLLAAVFFVSAIPFLFTGAALSMVISETIEKVDRVYFFDLLGAAAGCLLLVPFLNVFGGPNALLSAAVTFAVAASFWFSSRRKVFVRATCVGVALVLVGVMVINGKTHWLDLRFAKGESLGNELFVKWNSYSRVALREPSPGAQPEIIIDGDASTGIPPYDFSKLSREEGQELLGMGPGYVYNLRPGAKTLVIGAGGGWDIARALASGSTDVTGVEINAAIANTIMRERYPELSNRLYFRPEVKIVVEDGRSFVRRNDEQFGVIQLTLVDTWASTAAGAFALTENNLYTTDAFEDYLQSLSADGVLAISRWGFRQPRETLRLLTLAGAAFVRMGISDIRQHVIVVRENSRLLEGWGALDTVLIARSPWGAADVEKARQVANARGLELVYDPAVPGDSAYQRYLTAQNREAFFASYPYDVSPVSDNRPFFFYTVQPRDVWRFLLSIREGSADYKINAALPTLIGLFAISLVATLLILLAPPFLLKARMPASHRARLFLGYFACIGAGYILVQVSAIQKFVLLLGKPTYSLTVIIFSMLVASGLGSFFSRRVVKGDAARLRGVAFLAAFEIVLLALVAGPLTSLAVPWPMTFKIALTVVTIGIPAFTMGIPFPMGLDLLERWHAESVRWAWALNAGASVFGSVSAIVLAISFGLRETLLVGGACYVLAGFALLLPLSVRGDEGSTAAAE